MIKFFLLAAGYGKRARPLSLIKPKPLFPLQGKPLIELILEKFKYKGVGKGFINLCYQPEEIKKKIKYPEDIIFFYEKQLSGSKILNKATEYLNDSFLLVINGDVFVDVPVIQMEEKICKSGADGILLVRNNETLNYSSLKYHQDQYKGVYRIPQKGIMYAGVALFKQSVVEKIDELNFFLTLDNNGFDIRILFYDGIWLDIGDPRSYFHANFEYMRYNKTIENSNSNPFSENVFFSHDSRVENTIIWENTSINNKSIIIDSIITGNVTLDHVNYHHKIITAHGIYEL